MWQSSALSPNGEAGSPQECPLSDVAFTQPLHGEFYIENTDVSSSQIYLGYLFNISGVLYLSEHAFKTILYGRNRCDSQCLITLLFKSIRLMKIKINTTTYDHSHAYNELKLRNVEETVAVPHPTGFIRDCLCGSLCVSLRLFFSVAFPRNLNSRLRSKLSSLLSP